ncbi:MAG: histidine kinase [Flavipsychrobacter sp.]|nr:histidine kinase [Flavipsychrobacter sp.]
MALINKHLRWLLPLLALIIWCLEAGYLYYYEGLGLNIALIDSSVNMAILSIAIWGMLLVVNAYPTRVGVTLYALLIGSFFAVASGFSTWIVLRLLFKKQDHFYTDWLAYSMPVRYFANWLICGWIATYSAIVKEAETIEKKFLKQNDLTNMHREAELYKLRQQLQPHFLYNSLNSISALTMIEPTKAQDMIGKLSDFLRTSVKRDGQERIKLDEELQYIEAYLCIESVRFGDRLKVEYRKDYNPQAEIPPFILQPVMENAIKFGLYGKTGEVNIKVKITQKDMMLFISVTNPYDKDNQPTRGTGFGLEGIKRRLYLLFSRTDLLEISKTQTEFTTTLSIPQSYA